MAQLEHASREIVKELARGGGGNPERLECLEYFFSACLTAGKSSYYVLEKTCGRSFKELQRKWRAGLEDGGVRFGRMMGLRDDDVHFGETGAKPLPKVIEEDPYHQYYNPVLYGEMWKVEETNPNGQKVSGFILRGTVGLYLDHDGKRLEATTVCREFIKDLRSLLDAVKANASSWQNGETGQWTKSTSGNGDSPTNSESGVS